MSQASVPLEQRGFIHVRCTTCNNPEVWLRCQKCQKADHFWLEPAGVDCDCGSKYDHATCLCGNAVPKEQLTFVPFEKGPAALADLEWDWRRIAVLAAIAVAVVTAGVVGIWLAIR
jgi:hypothetical protein